MSKDIRSFFTVKKPAGTVGPTNGASKKRPVLLIESSSDEDVPSKPKKQSKKETKKRKVVLSDSDGETKPEKNKKINRKKSPRSPAKLKPMSAMEMFNTPIKRVEIPKDPPLLDLTEEDCFSDEDFIRTLKQVDEELVKAEPFKSPKVEKSIEEVPKTPKSSKKIETKSSIEEESPLDQSCIENTPGQEKKRKKGGSKDETLTDEERFERRRQSSVLYHQYLKRGGPPKPGSKEIPKGKPNCLKGLSFIITGILESLERDECASIISDLGGRVTKSVSGKLNYMVVGDDAGPAKTEKAKSLGLKLISEDELLDLIREKSGLPTLNGSKEIKTETSPPEIKKPKLNSENLKESKTEKSSPEIKKKSKINSEIKKEKPDLKKRKIEEEKPKESKFMKIINDTSAEDGEEESGFFKKETSPKKNKVKTITKKSEPIIRKTSPKKSKEPEPFVREKVEILEEDMAWVDKYKPKSIKSIIGQQGDNSNAKKLLVWLQNWFKNRDPSKKLAKPSPWAKSDDGAYFKAALLSGPPGIGKTTTATLVCKELGFDTVELNASDSRSKKLLQEDVGHLLSNTSLAGFLKGGEDNLSKRHVLLMDEVDGMAGNEDRGGMQELILLIKKSSIPIICMCNDRNHPKIRSLVNYCFDLKFSKPRVEQIRGAMMSVCFKEGIQIKPAILDQIISATQNDLRQTLNHLCLWSKGGMDLEKDANSSKKDIKLGPWDVVRKVFTEEEQKKMSIHDKSDLFFNDYSIAPLFVQENYLSVTPHANKKEWLDRVAEAADYLSLGDLVEKRIRSAGAWSLLPVQAMYSSVGPGHSMSGHFSGQINFPSWLGKNSKQNKFQRLSSELQIHTRLCTSGSRLAINLDYLTYIRDSVIRPLQAQNIAAAVQAMQEYHLTREDLDGLVELSLWPRQKDPLSIINGQVKASFTRAYNKEVNLVYGGGSTSKKKAASAENEEEYGLEEEEGVEESEDEDDVTKDNLIKAKKTAKAKAGEKSSKASSSKEKKTAKPRAKKTGK